MTKIYPFSNTNFLCGNVFLMNFSEKYLNPCFGFPQDCKSSGAGIDGTEYWEVELEELGTPLRIIN